MIITEHTGVHELICVHSLNLFERFTLSLMDILLNFPKSDEPVFHYFEMNKELRFHLRKTSYHEYGLYYQNGNSMCDYILRTVRT